MSEPTQDDADDSDRIPTMDPEVEPESVGAFSSLVGPECTEFVGDTKEEVERCGADATHTVVLYAGGTLHVLPKCDAHGAPDAVGEGRKWSDELIEELRIAGPVDARKRELPGQNADSEVGV